MTKAKQGKASNNEGSVYQRADGRWVAAVTMPSGRKSYRYRKTKKEAEAAKRAMLAEVEAGRATRADGRTTLAAYITNWLNVRIAGEVEAGHLDEATADSYRQLVEGHIMNSAVARVKLSALSAEDVRSWQKERLNAVSARGRKYSPRTVALAHAVLRRALGDAMRDEQIGRNAAALVKLPRNKATGVEAFTEDQYAAVFREMLTDPHRTLWFTMLAFGPRRGEALAMRWSLLDMEKATVKLRSQIRRVRGEIDPATGRRKTELVEKDLKTEASRATLALPTSLIEMLRVHRTEQVKARMAAKVWVDPDFVFATSVGTALEPRNVSRAWEALRVRAGVPGIRVHDLRHAAASLAFAEGASVKEVQAMLRHTRQATTSDVYVHLLESVRQGTASKMDDVLKRVLTGP